jgi:alkaline phosphatase D
VLGQQTLMGRMEFPASILKALNSSDTSPEAQALGTQAITDYLTAKGTAAAIAAGAPLTLTAYQQGLLSPVYNPKLGYNLDAWDGYPAAREILLGTAAAMGKRLVKPSSLITKFLRNILWCSTHLYHNNP